MAIIKLTPSCKDYLWGGSRLRTDFGVQSDLDPLAEAWVLSCHPDGPSYLPDGTTPVSYTHLDVYKRQVLSYRTQDFRYW